jgi:hypothetical protein
MLNPGGPGDSPGSQYLTAGDNAGRWLAMSVLFFIGAALLVLGTPAVTTLFEERRGRGLGLLGSAVFAVGCVGVGGIAALMLMFRALALEGYQGGTIPGEDVDLVVQALEEGSLALAVMLWSYAFMLGVVLIALGLLRGKRVPRWVPLMLLGFIGVQLVTPLFEGDTLVRVLASTSLLLLAAGFTGVATNAASPRSHVPVTHALVRG